MASSLQAVAYHSITFSPVDTSTNEDKNTWDDWHLVPSSRPAFAMPSVKTQYIDIPGGDGILDLTNALTGRPRYGNRQGSFEFIVINGYGDWASRYSNIATYLHGRSFRATLDDDPLFFYEGRFTVNEWKSDAHYSRIVIDYNVGPYKTSTLSTGERWLWDPFRFTGTVTGRGDLIRTYKNLTINNSSLSVVYVADVYETSPIFVCRKINNTTAFNMTVTFNSKTYTLKLGSNQFDAITLSEGENTFVFNGTGVVSIDNAGGRL